MLPINLLVTTWLPEGEDGDLRQEALRKAIESWYTNLKYIGNLKLHVADDGSERKVQFPFPIQPNSNWDPTVLSTRQSRREVGASLNCGIREMLVENALLLYLVDDWELLEPFDLTPWARLLESEEDIGMVRLGPPHPWLTGQIIHHPYCDWYLKLDRHHFVYAHRPALYHPRFFKAYWEFDEEVSAYDCERLYNERFCLQSGPDIVLALPHPWQHIDTVELAGVIPG